MNTPSANSPSDPKDSLVPLENRLAEVLQQRETTQAIIKECQNELDRLVSKAPKRPQGTVKELNEKIVKLERERTIKSIPLSEEREILKQINKSERTKRTVEEFDVHDKAIKAKKADVAQLRESLKQLNNDISTLRTEISTMKTANQLGCKLEDLLGMKIDCPKEKLGAVIGKKGKNVKHLMEKSNVTVDIGRSDGDIRIVGSWDSLDSAASDLSRTLAVTEETIELPSDLVNYLTSKGIAMISEVRQRHPDVHFDIGRKSTKTSARGVPEDINSLKEDLLTFAMVKKTIQVRAKESSLIVGKQGATIEKLVRDHQVAIDVQRSENDSSEITLLGPVINVDSAYFEIEEILEANKELEHAIPISTETKTCLLLSGGVGIQQLFKRVNEATKVEGHVNVNIGEGETLMLKGKQKLLDLAIPIAEEELKRLETLTITLNIDPVVIPVVIGKGGKAISDLKNGKAVSVEFDRALGTVTVCALNKVDLDAVQQQLRSTISQNIVERLQINAIQYKASVKDFLRSRSKEVNGIVSLSTDDSQCQMILRGSEDNVKKAASIILEFFKLHYVEEVEITVDEMSALLTGGKKSRIVDFAAKLEVNLNTDRERGVLRVRGDEQKVVDAVREIKSFLSGGEGASVAKFKLDKDLVGILIGKGGKAKSDLELKYKTVSITIHGSENAITLRGPTEDVTSCGQEITRIITKARVTRRVELSEEEFKSVKESTLIRSITRAVPVQIVDSKTPILVMGTKADVQHAVALLHEHLTGVYKSIIDFEERVFSKIKEAFRDDANLKRMGGQSGAKIAINEASFHIEISGKRDEVKLCKVQVYRMLEFLLGSGFSLVTVSEHLIPAIGDVAVMAEVSATSGARLYLDRDMNSIAVFALDSQQTAKAVEALRLKLAETERLAFMIQLESDEDWIVSSVVGKNGAGIKALRQELSCKIDVDSANRRFLVTSDDDDRMSKAKARFMEVVDKARTRRAIVTIPAGDLPAFVGKAGKSIKDFSERHKVDVQIVKGKSDIRLTGDPPNVDAARDAVQEWITSREIKRVENAAEETTTLSRQQLPAVIGPKGIVVRNLEREFGCKIDINRSSGLVTVRGATRVAAIEKIKKIASDDLDPETRVGEQRRLKIKNR